VKRYVLAETFEPSRSQKRNLNPPLIPGFEGGLEIICKVLKIK